MSSGERTKKDERQEIEIEFLKHCDAFNAIKAQDEDAIRMEVKEKTKIKWGKTTIRNDLISLEDKRMVKRVGKPMKWYINSTGGKS